MKNKTIVLSADNINPIITTHGIGWKKVFATNEFCESNLMQAAIGSLISGEVVDYHKHKTMEEFYYFNMGLAEITIDDETYSCSSGTFIKVPVNSIHSLKANTDIQFIYWGIAV